MPTKFILNPKADLGNGIKYLDIIQETAQPLGESDIVVTDRPGQAVELAASAVTEGYDTLVAAGGDGTVHEVVNGIMSSGTSDVKMGVLPIGTGNDFAYVVGVPDDVPTAVRAIFQGRTKKVDLGLIEDDKGGTRYFANNMGVGLDANVVIRTAEITRVHGFLKYLAAVFSTLASNFTPYRLQMRFDQEEVQQEVIFTYLGIGTRGGGGFLLTPDASLEDGLIDSCTVPMVGRLRVVTLIYAAINGTHIHTPYVTMRKNEKIEIRSAEAVPIQVDGEVYARPKDGIRELSITSLPAALEIVY